MKVIIVGGGPAGMMAAITAAENRNEVILIEKNRTLGKKLLITGKGRCNITSSLEMEDFIKNTPRNGKFLYSAYENYTNKDIIEFLNKQGLKVKEERGNRIFPVTDRSLDVLECFKRKLEKLNVKIYFDTRVKELLVKNDAVYGVILEDGKKIEADKVILATGGMSYPLTGSNGDGYEISKKVGHNITDIKPSLVPLVAYENNICRDLQGLSLKNVKIVLEDLERKKKIYEDFGEMLFTHFGVSGPIILSASCILTRYKNIDDLLKDKKIKLHIDLKPALTFEVLEKRILRDFEENKNKEFKNSLDKLLPQKLINIIVDLSGINPEKRVNEITKNERQELVKLLKDFCITIKDFRPIDEAIITSGGVNIKEVNPKTMESKIINNLYFAGELLDVDSYTGGFNLQIAYSTGYTAGLLN